MNTDIVLTLIHECLINNGVTYIYSEDTEITKDIGIYTAIVKTGQYNNIALFCYISELTFGKDIVSMFVDSKCSSNKGKLKERFSVFVCISYHSAIRKIQSLKTVSITALIEKIRDYMQSNVKTILGDYSEYLSSVTVSLVPVPICLIHISDKEYIGTIMLSFGAYSIINGNRPELGYILSLLCNGSYKLITVL